MPDGNDERELSDLLREIAAEDRRMAVPTAQLERRLTGPHPYRFRPATASTRTAWLGMAAAAIVVSAIAVAMRQPRAPQPEQTAAGEIARETLPRQAAADAEKDPAAVVTIETPAQPNTTAPRRAAARTPSEPRVISFTPLLPLSEQELGGSLQMVRIRFAAAAGADPVEADVLVGEDGLARAIRVSDDMNNFWRVR